jgi:hypothetical protein
VPIRLARSQANEQIGVSFNLVCHSQAGLGWDLRNPRAHRREFPPTAFMRA